MCSLSDIKVIMGLRAEASEILPKNVIITKKNYLRKILRERHLKNICKQEQLLIRYDVSDTVDNHKPCYLCRKGSYMDFTVEPPARISAYQPHYCHDNPTLHYRPHFLCFDCRRTWKPTMPAKKEYSDHYSTGNTIDLTFTKSKCGVCSKWGIPIGSNCRAPPHKDLAGWKALKTLIENGESFYPACKCNSKHETPKIFIP